VIHLIGIRHDFQVAGRLPNDEFLEYPRGTATALRATVIAEELSDDGEKAVGGHEGKSIAAIVAADLNIRHVFCDPNKTERKLLGIKSDEEIIEIIRATWLTSSEDPQIINQREREKDFPVREAVWIDRLRPHLHHQSIIFICGALHVPRFKVLLESEGNSVSVVVEEWAP
jgi:hypothetical protein